MPFTEKQLQFTFSGAASGTLKASGLRAAVSIQSFPGQLGNVGRVKVWGLTMSQMEAYCGHTVQSRQVVPFNLVIEAGDLGDPLSTVINGPIWASFIDLSGAPDSAFNVTVAGIYPGSNPVSPQSWGGDHNAETLIASLCALGGIGFKNPSGAHNVLRNPATYGSPIEQIKKIAHAANFDWHFDGDTVWIWPHGGTRGSTVIDIGPETGMVGYPMWNEMGLMVQTEFNPQIQIGYQVKLTSSIPKANGIWNIAAVYYDLSTMLDKGPWFTTALLIWPKDTP